METQMIVAVITLTILVAFALAFRDKTSYHRIPRRIWTYWEEPDHVSPDKRLSDTATKCIESWRKWNPKDEVIVLTKRTYPGYVTIPEEIRTHPLFTDRFSDLLRLWVLAERGGVWMDPTVFVTSPLEDWLFPKYAEFAGYYREARTTDKPMIQSWFLACQKGSLFIMKWRDSFSELVRYAKIESYLAYKDISVQDPMNHLMEIAVQDVLRTYPMNRLILRKEESMDKLVKFKK